MHDNGALTYCQSGDMCIWKMCLKIISPANTAKHPTYSLPILLILLRPEEAILTDTGTKVIW